MSDKDVCIKAVPGLFASGEAIWEDGGDRDDMAYAGCSWENVRKYDERVIQYEAKLKRERDKRRRND